MKKNLTIVLIIFSIFLWPQYKSKVDDVDKVMLWLQFLAADNEVSVQYDSVKFRNNVLVIKDLNIGKFNFPNDFDREKTTSLQALIEQGSMSHTDESITIKEVSMNFELLESFQSWVDKRDQKSYSNMFKSMVIFELDGFSLPVSVILDETEDELTYSQIIVAKRMADYLNDLNLKFEQKGKGKLRSSALFEMELGKDFSLSYSVDRGYDDANITNSYFNMIEGISSIMADTSDNFSYFIELADECEELYEKDNLNAWLALADQEYCMAPQELSNSWDFEERLDELNEEIEYIESEILLNSLQYNGKEYGQRFNAAWSERFYDDVSLSSEGVIDIALFTLKGLFENRLNKQEFEILLQQMAGPDLGVFVSELFVSDDLYKIYTDYQPKIRAFANKPRGLGLSIESKDGIDSSSLIMASENPLLLFSLLDSIEIELLLNKKK
ncbi:MAG: hypothetical protein CMQ57_01405 [Gammaproteobacteria bacterium]|nr:hypothetical protein [Gammaproteobacteria bacterium]